MLLPGQARQATPPPSAPGAGYPQAAPRSTQAAQGSNAISPQPARKDDGLITTSMEDVFAAIPGLAELGLKNPQQAMVLATVLGPLLQYQKYMGEGTLRTMGQQNALAQMMTQAGGGQLTDADRMFLQGLQRHNYPEYAKMLGINPGTTAQYDLANRPDLIKRAQQEESAANAAVEALRRERGMTEEAFKAANAPLYDPSSPAYMRQNFAGAAARIGREQAMQRAGADPTVFHDPMGMYDPSKLPPGMKYKGPDGRVIDPRAATTSAPKEDYPAGNMADMAYNPSGSPYGAPFATNYSAIRF